MATYGEWREAFEKCVSESVWDVLGEGLRRQVAADEESVDDVSDEELWQVDADIELFPRYGASGHGRNPEADRSTRDGK